MAHKIRYVPPEATYEERPAAPRHSVAVDDAVVVRRAETSDSEPLIKLASPEDFILTERFGSWDIRRLSEQSLLAITAQDAYDPAERSCGFAAFSDAPNWAEYIDSHKWPQVLSDCGVVMDTSSGSLNAANSMWLHLFFADHALENDAINTVMSTAFATLSEAEFCLFALPSSIPLFAPLADAFEEAAKPPAEVTGGKQFIIYMARRQSYIPEMFIRPARVEDHDDLLPVFGNQAGTLNERYGEYGLSDVLANQSETMRTLVAEVEGRAIGLISLNSDVELIKVLGSCFELTSYDHLMKYPEGVIPPSMRTTHIHDDEEDEDDREESEEGDYEEEEDRDTPIEGDSGDEGAGGMGMGNSLAVSSMAIPSISRVEDDDVDDIERDEKNIDDERERGAYDDDLNVDAGGGGADSDVESEASDLPDVEGLEPNAFAVTLFCIAEGFESRAYELLGPAFDAFPDRDFCVITLPHTSLEFPLLSHFNIVPTRFSGTFPQVLYVFHRHGLLSLHGHLSTRSAVPDDMAAATDMCSTLENGKEVLEAFNLGIVEEEDEKNEGEGDVMHSFLKSYVAVADDSVAGLVVIETSCIDANEWRKKYRLDDFVDWTQHDKNGHCELIYFVVNPIFERSAKSILNDTLRLAGKTAIHHRVFADQPVINILRDLIPVRPRRAIENVVKKKEKQENDEMEKIARDERDEKDENENENDNEIRFDFNLEDGLELDQNDSFALYFLAKKHISEQKVVVNSRIVVVGASSAGIAFLEHLSFVPYLHFTSLCLVSEGGLPTEDTDHFLPDHLAYDEDLMHQLSLRSKIRVVDDKLIGIDREQQLAILPFDAVVPYDFLVLTPGLQDQTAAKLGLTENENEYRGVFTLRNEHILDTLRSYAPLKRPDAPRRSIVYGKSMEALCAVQGLLESGESPKDIVMCWPPHSASFSDDEHVTKTISSTLAEMGIRCYHDMTLKRAESERGRIFAAIFEPSARAGLLGPLPTNDEYVDNGHDTPVVPIPKARGDGDDDDDSEHDDDDEYEGRRLNVGNIDQDSGVGEMGDAALPDLRLFCKSLILCAGSNALDLDPDTHQAIDTACIVYDGRLVVDGEFRTNDPHIFAGGSVARFSRRLGKEACQAYLDQFDSVECGSKLAQALLTRVDPLSDGTLLLTEAAPVFEEPTTVHCVLPGNLHYFSAEQTKKLTNHPVTTEGRSLSTVNKASGDYFRMFIDKYNRISSITYIGKSPIEAHNLKQLIDLPETLLNDLERRFDEGQIDDLPSFLREPWTEAIYHDRFADFRLALGTALNDLAEWDELAQKAREMVDNDELDTVNRKNAAPLRALLPPNANLLIKKKLMEWLQDNSNILETYFIKQ